jgi:hypothetical protein
MAAVGRIAAVGASCSAAVGWREWAVWPAEDSPAPVHPPPPPHPHPQRPEVCCLRLQTN